MSRVLIVEDDEDIAAAVRDHLRRESIESVGLTAMAPVWRRLRQGDISVILLDVMLPDGSGFDLCRDLRAAGVTVPIIMLTAKSEDSEQVHGLEVGADDYVTKPFTAATLIARIKAQLRRAIRYSAGDSDGVAGPEHGRDSTVVSLGDREIDFAASEIRRASGAVDMTAMERQLLSVLVQHANEVFTRDRLFRVVWGDEHFGDPGTVTVHIRRLREKLEDDPSSPRFLQTVRGLGYRFRCGELQSSNAP